MHFLETLVPPPVVALTLGVLMWLASRLTPFLTVNVTELVVLGSAVGSAGLVLEVVAAITFRRRCTTVNPMRPAAATSLVVTGVYRFTRNPIYLGDLLLLVGWAVFLGNPLALILTPLFVIYMDRFQIHPEERVLAAKFGESYAEYSSRVRRWV